MGDSSVAIIVQGVILVVFLLGMFGAFDKKDK